MRLTRLVMVEVNIVKGVYTWGIYALDVVENGDVMETRARKWSGFMCERRPEVERVSS